MSETVCVIVLAAGAGRRFGGRKLLAPVDGRTVIRITVEGVLASIADDVVVVLGSDADDVSAALDGLAVRLVTNQDWRSGQGSSIAAGVGAAGDAAAVVIAPGDQPAVDPALFDNLIMTYHATRPAIVVPEFDGQARPPVLFDRTLYPRLLGLAGDRGARHIVDENRARAVVINVPGPAPGDIDTIDDYQRFLKARGGVAGQ